MSALAPHAASRFRWTELVTHRTLIGAASALFILPNVIFAGWLRPLPAGLVLVGGMGGLWLVLRAGPPQPNGWLDQPVKLTRLGALVALSAAIFLLGGQGHVFYPNPDWLIRDAVLADLVRTRTIPVYSLPGGEYVMRAPLGLYMVPALVGRVVGLAGAHATLLAQNACLLGATLYLLTEGRRPALRLAILVLFAGLCILPRISGVLRLGAGPSLLFSDARPLDEWSAYFQYSSSVVQFFWVPNHALPGWWLAALAILCRRGQVDLTMLAFAIGSMVFWSPLAIIPGVPFALYLVGREGVRCFASLRLWAGAAAALCFLPVATYLVLGSSEIAHGLAGARPNFWAEYILFLIVQLPAAAYVLARWTRLPADLGGLFTFSLAVLVVLPFVSFGPSNDLVMRGSIAALVIVAFCFADVVLAAPPDREDWRSIAIALVALSALSAVLEVTRAVRTPTFPISDCTLIEASAAAGDPGLPTNYIVSTQRLPAWLMELPNTRLRSYPGRRCGPEPLRPELS